VSGLEKAQRGNQSATAPFGSGTPTFEDMIGKRISGRMAHFRTALPKVLLASLLLVAAPTQAALAADNAAVAINTKDGSSIFKLAFHVHRTMNQVIDETNVAVAFASCEGCQTVAIAIQIVLVMSDPSVVTPENLALALNVECTSCETLAGAYQFVISTDGSAKFSKEGKEEILAIRKGFHDLAKRAEAGELSIAEIQAESEALVTRLEKVLDAEFRPPADDEPGEATPGEGEEGESPEPEQTPSVAEEPSPSPSPSESPTNGDSTPSGSEEQTDQPTPEPTSAE
jgi:putative peptide zinc metalloprotease protein